MTEIRRVGRQRSEAAKDAILRASLELLLEIGYSRLTIEGVAERAGAGKSTIYRWWPSKGALVLEAAEEHLEIGVVPDTGSTRGDLVIAARQVTDTFTDPVAAAVIFVVLAGLEEDPSLAMTFMARWVQPWRDSLAEALQRGVRRGDIPAESDVEFLLDVLVGTVFQRTLVVREPNTQGLEDLIADLLLNH
jgi:AcrR family transcriptional regulator